MEKSNSGMLGPRLNFDFAFNNTDFSDRVLHIEIMADSEGAELDTENDIEVKTLNISFAILAANSPFFVKLFNNGMRETQEKEATLRINKSEDAALIDLLKFMHNNTLNATTTPDLLDVLIIADKFEVTSCIKYCSVLLEKRPMSLESALLYIELTQSFLVVELVQPLIDLAKKWLVSRFKNIIKAQEEAMTLALSVVEVVLSSDTLQVDSKDDLFEFIFKWAHAQFPELEVRREILSTRLAHSIPFTSMSYSKLKQVLVCPEFDHEEVSKLVIDALFFKAQLPHEQCINSSNKCQVIKGDQIGPPNPRCVIYFDINKEECKNLFPSSSLQSPSFSVGGRWFYLLAKCYTNEQQKWFSVFMYLAKESESFTLDYCWTVAECLGTTQVRRAEALLNAAENLYL